MSGFPTKAGVTVEGVSKAFGGPPVLKDIGLDIPAGAFVALLGPSGCGKTTLLRLVAGLERTDSGTIRIGGRVVSAAGTHVEPERRGLGMVFQSYALWPHMSVAGNVEFGLKVRGLPAPERRRRVDEALEAVGLSAYAARRPAALSGGQRQRVALARCLAMKPPLILLDEPLANLDVHLRHTMLTEFRRLHRELGATFVYVTHDQAEAMALAEKVAVMFAGRLAQLGSPEELYDRPSSPEVARFIGRGAVLPVTVTASSGTENRVLLAGTALTAEGTAPEGAAWLMLRPDSLAVRPGTAVEGELQARVTDLLYQGGAYALQLEIEGHGGLALSALAREPLPVGASVAVAVNGGWVMPQQQEAA